LAIPPVPSPMRAWWAEREPPARLEPANAVATMAIDAIAITLLHIRTPPGTRRRVPQGACWSRYTGPAREAT
jgi:hypothetical protein